MNKVKSTSLISDFFHIRKIGNYYVANWDKEIIKDENGNDTDRCTFWQCAFTHKPSLQEIKSFILGEINEETDSKILQGFVWVSPQNDNVNVWLSSENQFNYKAVYDLAVQTQGASLPFTLKFGSTDSPQYYTFDDLATFSDFYQKSLLYVNTTIQEGWRKKDSIDWSVYEIGD